MNFTSIYNGNSSGIKIKFYFLQLALYHDPYMDSTEIYKQDIDTWSTGKLYEQLTSFTNILFVEMDTDIRFISTIKPWYQTK